MLPWLSLVACKAVLTAHAASACRSIEFDLQIVDDGSFVVSHEPVKGVPADLKGKVEDFDSFVKGMGEHRFDFVNIDIKERSLLPGDGRLSRALARHSASLARLASLTGTTVATTPVPTRYAELERFLKRDKSAIQPGLELADYTAEDARRWKLPLTRVDAALMPLGGLANSLYLRWRGKDIRYLSVQERTAKELSPREGRVVFCWSRDPVDGPPPEICRWTER